VSFPILPAREDPGNRAARSLPGRQGDAVWWGGALVAAVIGAGFLLSGDRIPEPLAVEAGVPDVGEGPRAATQATN
jgi:hypothetical protein